VHASPEKVTALLEAGAYRR